VTALLDGGLVRPRVVADPSVRVLLMHHAGGSDLEYRRWARHFPADWEVLVVRLPARSGRTGRAAVGTVAELCARLADQVAPLADRPLALFGHSMGALICYELARVMAARGLPAPVWLGVSAHPGPRRRLDWPGTGRLSSERLRTAVGGLGGLDPEALRDDALWSFVEPMLRRDLELVASWPTERVDRPLTVPLTSFCGDADPLAGPASAAGWSRHTERFLGVRVHRGGHFYFRADVEALVGQIVAEVRPMARRRR